MARLSVTAGEQQMVIADWRPFLSRRRLRSWRFQAERFFAAHPGDAGELSSQVQLVPVYVRDEDDDEDEEDMKSRPSLGFRSGLPRA